MKTNIVRYFTINPISGKILVFELWAKMLLANQIAGPKCSIQNKKFAHLSKKLGDEVDFLPADKHERFLQVDSITLGVRSQACPKYPK